MCGEACFSVTTEKKILVNENAGKFGGASNQQRFVNHRAHTIYLFIYKRRILHFDIVAENCKLDETLVGNEKSCFRAIL